MRPSTLRKILRRRGSVLILVVALLVLLALVGTAYLTTTRFDRSAAVANVVNTQKDFVFDATANALVPSTLLDDIVIKGSADGQSGAAHNVRPPSNVVVPFNYEPVDMPTVDPEQASREPMLQWTLTLNPGNQTIARPVWRAISWPSFSSAEVGNGWFFEQPDNNYLVQPNVAQPSTPAIGPVKLVVPYENGERYKKGQIVMGPGPAAGSFDYYIRTGNNPGAASSAATAPRDGALFYPPGAPLWEKCDPKQWFTYAPSTVEIKGKIYPALYIINNYVAADWQGYNAGGNVMPYITGPILAGDADGDGIADSAFRKMPLGQLNGLTYYVAMRIVDHNSAININTAWASDFDFDFTNQRNANNFRLGTLPNWGFFPGNIGLRELFQSANLPNAIGEPQQVYPSAGLNRPQDYYTPGNGPSSPTYEPLLEITRHNLYRMGFADSSGSFSIGLGAAQDDGSQSPTWIFRTINEAMFTQVARRPNNVGFVDNAEPLARNVNASNGAINSGDTINKPRWLDLARDGGVLAFKGGVLTSIDSPPSDLERRFISAVNGTNVPFDSIFAAADNQRAIVTNDASIGSFTMEQKRSYPLLAPRSAAGNLRGTSAVVDRWFDINFNYDRYHDNARFVVDPSSTNEGFFRNIRPLLVTSNAVSSVAPTKAGLSGLATVPIGSAVQTPLRDGTVNVSGTAYGRALSAGNLSMAAPYQPGGIGLQVPPGIDPEALGVTAIIGTFSVMRQYHIPTSDVQPPQWAATNAASNVESLTPFTDKVSVNTAQFGDLWRGYWSVMAEDWTNVPLHAPREQAPVDPLTFGPLPGTGRYPVTNVTGSNGRPFTPNNNSGTPFDYEIGFYELSTGGAARPQYGGALFDPYVGSHFSSGTASVNISLTSTATVTFANNDFKPLSYLAGIGNQRPTVAPSEVDPATPGTLIEFQYHPARMFRSPVRSFAFARNANATSPPLVGGTPAINSSQFTPPLALPTAAVGLGTLGHVANAVPDANQPLVRLRPDQVVLLRSALAAINAEDMRDTDFKVTRRTIQLRGAGRTRSWFGGSWEEASDPLLSATINGYEPQPFITEVFAHTNTGTVTGFQNPFGYIAIELHNPYPFPIDIKNCKFAVINRYNDLDPGYPNLRVVDMELQGLETTGNVFQKISLNGRTTSVPPYGVDTATVKSNLQNGNARIPKTVVPANGYLVLENYDADGGATDPQRATYRPKAALGDVANGLWQLTAALDGQGLIQDKAGARVNFAYVRNLHLLFNREFVLMRPIDVENELQNADTAPPTPVADPNFGLPPFNGFLRREMSAVVAYTAGAEPDRERTSVRTLTYADPLITQYAAGGPVFDPNPPNNNNRPRTRAVDMVPLDQFDLTGLMLPLAGTTAVIGDAQDKETFDAAGGGDPANNNNVLNNTLPDMVRPQAAGVGLANAWHYVRGNESLKWVADDVTPIVDKVVPGKSAWMFVYPGRYDGTKWVARSTGTSTTPILTTPTPLPRQQGTRDAGPWDFAATGAMDPWDAGLPTGPKVRLGLPDAEASYLYDLSDTLEYARRGMFPIPLANRGYIPFGIDSRGEVGSGNTLGFGWFPARATNLPVTSTVGVSPFITVNNVLPSCWPFGGFARNGDLLDVPFIGSYRLQYYTHVGSGQILHNHGGGTLDDDTLLRDYVVELNSITMDAAMAEDTDVNTDPVFGKQSQVQLTVSDFQDTGFIAREQIGRFQPLRKTWARMEHTYNPAVQSALTNEPMDYYGWTAWSAAPSSDAIVQYDDETPNIRNQTPVATEYPITNLNRYRWAADLFEYLTVQSASEDFQPNAVRVIDEGIEKKPFLNNSTLVKNAARGTGNTGTDMNLPTEGLVNINSASERVLALVPWLPKAMDGFPTNDIFTFANNASGGVTFGSDGVEDNLQLARAIVRFRQGYEDRNETFSQFAFNLGYDRQRFTSRPFQSIWDLYRVPEFRNIQALLLTPEPFSPINGTPDPSLSFRSKLDDRFGNLAQFAHDFYDPFTGGLRFDGRFFAPGDRVLVRDNNGVKRYECVRAHMCSSSTRPPNDIYWRAEDQEDTAAPLPNTLFGFSGPRFDFKDQSLLLTRVSNLITTRSDMFTAYLVVEGWENAGTPNAELKVSKRAAFFLDRSQTVPGKIELKAPIPIPTE